jgi:hypothetical protein
VRPLLFPFLSISWSKVFGVVGVHLLVASNKCLKSLRVAVSVFLRDGLVAGAGSCRYVLVIIPS